MTKGIFIESVLLSLNGGILNDESAIKRRDIAAFLPSAVNYAMFKSYNMNIRVDDTRDVSSLFVGTFYDLPVIRELGRVPKITMPKGTMALPRNQGIRLVENGCGQSYVPLADADVHNVKYYLKIYPKTVFFRLKGAKDLEMYNLNPLVQTIGEVNSVVRVEDLEDTDELPLQAGVEEDAMDICIKHFTGQRNNPADKLNNTVDLNAQQQ